MSLLKVMNMVAPALALALASPAMAANKGSGPQETVKFLYTDLADLLDNASIVALGKVNSAKRLKGELAQGVPAGYARFLMDIKVSALLRGDQGLPPRITYLLDLPLDASNRPPKVPKTMVAVAANPVPGKPGFLRLVSARAQLPWSPELEARLRALLAEIVAPNAPPHITGITGAFHVRGTLPGESETQIFLKTRNGQPVSVGILRRPGEQTRWSVALGEMTDDSARPPVPDSLLWYRLACFLPKALPADSVSALDQADAVAANVDYRFVIESLGPCTRTATAR